MTTHFRPDPKITGTTEATIKETGEVFSSPFQFEMKDIRREYMDEIKQLIGDSNARVTVSAEFGIKDFGTGASAMCSVSLTCGQDIPTVEKAAQLAGAMARDIAQEQRTRAEQELQAILDQRRLQR